MKKTILLSILIGLGLMLALVNSARAVMPPPEEGRSSEQQEWVNYCWAKYDYERNPDLQDEFEACYTFFVNDGQPCDRGYQCFIGTECPSGYEDLKAKNCDLEADGEICCKLAGVATENIIECEDQCLKIDPAQGEIFHRCVDDCLKSPIAVRGHIVKVLDTVVNWISLIIGAIAVLMLIIGGIMYMTAAGSEDKVGKAKNVLKYAVIGLVIALIAWGVKGIILSFMS